MAHYMVKVAGREYDIAVDYRQQGYRVTINGRPVTVQSSELSDSRAELLIDNRSYEVDMQTDGYDNERSVFMLGVEIPVEIEDFNLARLRKTAGMASGGATAKRVKAPMPGLILEIKVAPGDRVQKGTPLLVIEAMKMENVVKAPAEAVVKTVAVTAGAAVERHDTLLEFE